MAQPAAGPHVNFQFPPGQPPPGPPGGVGPPPPPPPQNPDGIGGVAGGPPQQQHPAAVPLPAYLMPAPTHGDIARRVYNRYGGNPTRFVEQVRIDMTNMQGMLTQATGNNLLVHSIGVATGPCAFLVITPTGYPDEPPGQVVHCTRQYIIPAEQPGAANDPMQQRMISFCGDMSLGQLPRALLEPPLALPGYFAEAEEHVPTDEAIDEFYANRDNNVLMPPIPNTRMAQVEQHLIRRIIYIPAVWAVAFLDGFWPKDGLNRMRELVALMPPNQRADFDPQLRWMRMACQKGNNGAAAPSCRLVPYSYPRSTPYFRQWSIQQLQAYYQTPPVGLTPTGANPSLPPTMDFNAFGNSLARGLSQGLSTVVQGVQALQPVQPVKATEDFTPLQQRMILKLMGKEADADFDQVSPPVWQRMVEEGKTAEGIQRVMRDEFAVDPNDPDGPEVTPFISRQTAKDIKACSFAPDTLTRESSVQGILPMAFAPRSGRDRQHAADDEALEDAVNNPSSTDVLSRRAKEANRARPPKNYVELVDCMKAAMMVWTLLFTSRSPVVVQMKALRGALRLNRDILMYAMSAAQVAGFIWNITEVIAHCIRAPYEADGTPPQPNMMFLMASTRNAVFHAPVTMPLSFVASGSTPIIQQESARTEDESFGEHPGKKEANKKNPNVVAEVKSLMAKIKHLDEEASMAAVLRGNDVMPKDVVLAPGQCNDFMSFGICRKPTCTFKHHKHVIPAAERVKAFCDIVGPLVKDYEDKRAHEPKRARNKR